VVTRGRWGAGGAGLLEACPAPSLEVELVRRRSNQGREVGLAEHARQAAAIVGFASIELLGFRDQHLDTLSLIELIGPLEKKIRETRPQLIYTHFHRDLNRETTRSWPKPCRWPAGLSRPMSKKRSVSRRQARRNGIPPSDLRQTLCRDHLHIGRQTPGHGLLRE
jgi:hypothetical protein